MTKQQAAPPERQQWKGASLAARIKVVNDIFIQHRAVSDLFRYIERQLLINSAQGSADGVLVIAAPGSGKTHTIKQLELMYPSVVTPTLTTKPVVILNIPSRPNSNSMGEAMLKAIGDPLPGAGTSQAKLERIEMFLGELETKVVAIDNFQDIPARRQIRGIEELGDWVRNLCSMNFPGVVLAFGTEEAAVVRDSNSQLRRRMQARFELPIFSAAGKDALARWIFILTEIDKYFPLAQESGFGAGQFAGRLLVATGGNFDYLIKLLVQALTESRIADRERIEMEDLRTGFAMKHGVAAEGGNPFDLDFTSTVLDGPGQIFDFKSAVDKAEQKNGGGASKPRKASGT